ncbi:MAG: sialate O-acetylesterase [Planctomycetota bacterium]|nr:sialate O-acetylesterase [Planctomycetota bacterium]
MRVSQRFYVLLVIAVCTEAVVGQLRLASVFADRMVLQRDEPVCIWGEAAAGRTVTVEFAGPGIEAVVAADGRWRAVLPPLAASATGRELVVRCADEVLRVADVLVGDVWLCGGQSNMEWKLRSSRDADVEIESADTPEIRFLRLPKIARSEPQRDFPVKNAKSNEGNWFACVPEHAGNCTGVGYYFARRLHRRLQIPIGIIDTSWGGTMAQHWCTQETLRAIPAVEPYYEKYQARLDAWLERGGEEGAQRQFEADLAAWEEAQRAAKAAGEREPRKPRESDYRNPAHEGHPGAMFHGLISPLEGLALRGVLFYQGENNSFAEAWKPFPATFPAIIRDWRRAFGKDDLPVGLIQIAGWSNRRSMTYDMNHHTNIVREVQFDTWRDTPNTGLIVTYDTNSNGSIHPGRKLPVGERAARWALAEVYGIKQGRSDRALEWRGPVFDKARVEGNKIIASFVEETARGLRLDQDLEVGFYIAGEDREFHVARARVVNKTEVAVWCDAVAEPVAVRYGWSNLPIGGLMNARELPAYPFRSDDWPMVPHQSQGAYTRSR